nr:hypothetical protein [Tanacetum cinerariifolium]
TSNVVGSGPDWLFDIDALTRTMKYEPIVVGTQSNGFVDLKSSYDGGSKPSCDDGKKVDEDPRKESKCKDQEKEDNINSTNNVNIVSSIVNTAGINRVNVVDENISIELPFDPNMPALEDVSTFDFLSNDEDNGTKWVFRNKKDERGIMIRNKARLVDQGYTQEEGIDYDEVFTPIIEEEVYICQPPGFEDPDFPDRVYNVEKALYGLHQAPGAWFTEVKTASTPMETQKPLLKDEDGKEVDVHIYRLMIGSLMYLISSRPDIMYLKGQPKLGLRYPKDSPFDLVAYTNSDYARASLDRKSTTGEAKYVAASSCCGQVLWIQNQLLDYGGNTLPSDEDRLKLNELMELCTTLQNTILDLEKTKTTQCNEIDSLERRVKKLKKRNRSRTHTLKRLYKVGLSARVESFGDEKSLGEDASKQGRRIDVIDADKDITLVNDAEKEMFDVDDLGGEELFVARKNENVVEEVVNAAQVSTIATTITITTEEITLAQALEAL